MTASSELTSARPALYSAVAVSALLLAGTAFQWWLVDALTPFLALPLQGLLWVGFLAVSTWAVIRAIRYRGHWRISAIPLVVCTSAVMAALFVPLTQLSLEHDFAAKRAARERVVRDIYAGVLRPNVPHNQKLIALSTAERLSAGGNEIVVETHDGHAYVFFFTFRGILGNYAGFLFVPEAGDPRKFSDINEPTAELVRLAERWYFVAHH